MHRHARARVQVKAQRRGRLDPVQINHFASAQGRQVAAFAHLADQLAQYGMPCAVGSVVEQQVFRQPAQAQTSAVQAPITAAAEQMCRFQLLQHAVQRGLGQSGFVGQALQRKILVFRGNHLQQRKQAQSGRVPIDLRGKRGGQGSERRHRRMIAKYEPSINKRNYLVQ